MIRLWGRATSINVQKVMWLMAELGIEHERLDRGGPFGGLDDPEIRKRSPIGRIPVINDGAVDLFESNAICRYIAATYGAGSWWPDSPASRAAADQWMEWFTTTMYQDFITVFLQLVRVAAAERDQALVTACKQRTAAALTRFEMFLGDKPFVCGDQPTVGDLPVGAALYRYYALDYERPDLPRLAAYYERLKRRPAYATHVMLPIS